ncbi:MAG: sigma-70 family RNA polymerase sigma factor [Selenomonadaceae bacterium]|nr:sigma-70 family RNA polymerase sigma factor [Selenomonadaceae bacterium]
MTASYNNQIYSLEDLDGVGIDFCVMKAKIGNAAAKEKLFLSFLPLFKKYGGKNYNLKEDYIQEFGVKFLEAVNNFSFKQKIPFAAYIKNVVRANFTSLIRRENRFSKNHNFLNDEKWETIENTVEASKDNSFLQKENIINLLKNLTIREQEVLIYLYVLEKTPKEISDYLNLSVKTISNTKTRALNKLGKIIKRG